jgi:hypothetical protein
MTEWSKEIAARFKQELAGVNEKDLRFFRIEEYLRIVKRIDEFADSCPQCKQFQPEIGHQAETIGRAIKNTGKERAAYDRHSDKLARHMKKVHGFYPPYYYTYSLGFLYTLVATTVAYAVSFLFPSIDPWMFVVPGFIIGLLAGQLKGAQKDAKVRADNKLL